MFRQLIARIQDDDNPRLHRVPFMMLWISSYGLGWFVLRVYENLWYGYSPLCQFFRWLKGHYNPNPTWNNWWREDIFVGTLFAIMISLVQTWLLKRRYGYVPKFWGIATFIGAVLAGFGYPRVGLAAVAYFPNRPTFALDFLIWFSVLGMAQAIVMFRVNRQAWQIAAVGLIAGMITSGIYLFGVFGFASAKLGLLTGIGIQTIGTGLVMMRLMVHPREGIVPKRDDSEKSKVRVYDGFHPATFLALWVGVYFMARLVLILIWELFYVSRSLPIVEELNNWIFYTLGLIWFIPALFHMLIGFIAAIGQKWLIEKYSGIKIRRWILFNALGWGIAGICIAIYWYGNPMSSDIMPLEMRRLWLMGYFIVAGLFQTLPMIRSILRGWFWAVSGFVASMPMILLFTYPYQLPTVLILVLGGLIFSLSTGLIFIFGVQSATQNEKIKRVEEVL